ncbi:MAG: hypothetical protein IJ746_02480 [Ruminococcus sp.]|nr:hypothetical protein [Ruminococcus sp.]
MKLNKRYISAVCAAVMMAGALVSCGSYEFPADKIYTLFPVSETSSNDSSINKSLSPGSGDEAIDGQNGSGEGDADGSGGANGGSGTDTGVSGTATDRASAGNSDTPDGGNGSGKDGNGSGDGDEQDGKAGNGGKSTDDDKDGDGKDGKDGKTTTKSTTKKTTTEAVTEPPAATTAPQQTPAQTQAPQTVYIPPETSQPAQTQAPQPVVTAPAETTSTTTTTAQPSVPAENPHKKKLVDITGNADQEECLKYVNAERAAMGLAPLVLDKDLCAAAEVRVKELPYADQNNLHERPNNLGSSIQYIHEVMEDQTCFCAENAATGYYDAWEVMYLQEEYTYTDKSGKQKKGMWYGWMYTYLMDGNNYLTSKYSHKANILNANYKRIGIAFDSSTGDWIQLFYG